MIHSERRPSTRRLLAWGLAGVLLAATLAGLLAAPARAAWMVPPRPWRAKDFAIIKRDGLYHIFYTRTNIGDPYGPTSENALGHAVSYDLFTWLQCDSVLPIRPGGWDNFKIWAPTLVKSDGVYYMLYTGVTDHPGGAQFHQQIGLATSTDLSHWNRLDAPVYTCEQVPWSYCDSLVPSGGNFRDPFVMPDPSAAGHWLMYLTTVPSFDTGKYEVGLASSSGALDQWTDVKPMLVTDRITSGWELAESSHLFQHAGQWNMMWTTNAPEPIVWATGSDPTGEPPSWVYHGSIGTMLGFTTRYWFASEFLRDGSHDYFAFVNFDRVDVRQMQWNPSGTFALTQPDYFHVVTMQWSRDSVETGWADTLTVHAVNGAGKFGHFEVVTLDSITGAETALSAASVGLPDSLSLGDSLTTFVWAAQRVSDSLGVPQPSTRYLIRMVDQTASAAPLFVGGPGSCAGGGGDKGGGEIIDPAVVQQRANRGPSLRTLARTPLSEAPALLVDLPVAMNARLEVFDLQGRRVSVLANRTLSAGATVLPWDATARGGLNRGVFFARLTTAAGTRWSRILLLR